MNFIQKSITAKVIVASVLAVIVSMSFLAFFVINNTFSTMKKNHEEFLNKETNLLLENISTFNTVAILGANSIGDLFDSMLLGIDVDYNTTIQIGENKTPLLHINNKAINLNFDIVDYFQKVSNGSVATIFVKVEDDFVRVSTNVKKEDGSRAIGTKLDRTHPSYKNLIKGEPFTGKALLFGKEYMSKYIPIKKDGKIIAVSYIGFDITNDMKEFKKSIESKTIGKSGFFKILNKDDNFEIENSEDYLIISKNYNAWSWKIVAVVKYKEILESVYNTMYLIIILSIIATILLSFAIFFTLKLALKSLKDIQTSLNSFFNYLNKKSNSVELINIKTIDEFGQIARQINENIKLVEIGLKEDKEFIDETILVLNEFSNGDFSQRLKIDINNPALNNLKNVLNSMASNLEKNIVNILEVLKEYSRYDYTKEIENKDYKAHLLNLVDGINSLSGSIKSMLNESKNMGVELEKSSKTLLENVDKLNLSANTTASSLEETSASIEEITSNIRNSNLAISNIANISKELQDKTKKGEDMANRTSTAMQEINSSVLTINDAIGVIDQIAFQTNILSLNAAVEAATAGEAGYGFAVVAGEVRNLANRSAEAANEIKNIVQRATSLANSGKDIAQAMIEDYQNLSTNIKSSTNLILDIEYSSKEQLLGVEQINSVIDKLDNQTQQNAIVSSKTKEIALETEKKAKELVQNSLKMKF